MDISIYIIVSSLILGCVFAVNFNRYKYRKLERIQKKICQALTEAGYPIKEDKGVGYRYSMRDKDD